MFAQIHHSILSHRKTRRLKRLLRLGRDRDVLGILTKLWLTALIEAEDGSLSGFDPVDIATALEWDDDPDVLVSSLIDSGFLEPSDDGLRVHDWLNHTGKALTIRAKNRYNQRKFRNKASVSLTGESSKGGDYPAHLSQGFASHEDMITAGKGITNEKD